MPAALEVSTRTLPSSPYLLVCQGRCCHTRYGCGIKLHPFWLCGCFSPSGGKKLARKLAASYRRSFLHTFKRSCPNAVWQCWCASSQGTMHICYHLLTWSYLYKTLKSLFVTLFAVAEVLQLISSWAGDLRSATTGPKRQRRTPPGIMPQGHRPQRHCGWMRMVSESDHCHVMWYRLIQYHMISGNVEDIMLRLLIPKPLLEIR